MIVGCFLKFTWTHTDCKQGSVLCRSGGPGLIFVYNKTRYKILTTRFLSSIPSPYLFCLSWEEKFIKRMGSLGASHPLYLHGDSATGIVLTSGLCLHYRPETVHCSTKDAYTSEITFLALHPCPGLTTNQSEQLLIWMLSIPIT